VSPLLSRPFTTSTRILEPRHEPADSSGPHPKTTIPWPTHANPSPYEIFHLPRNASLQEIKKQYFHLVKQYHPDHSSHVSSVDRFRKVVEAYKVLSHPTKRHDYDQQHPPTHPVSPRHSEFRRPPSWSGSRLSRQQTEQKGPPGGWSYAHARKRGPLNPDFEKRDWMNSEVDNEHFSYEKHFRRNLEMETRIKRRMDEMHARRAEMEKKTEMERGTIRMGMAFTGGLFVLIMLAAKMMFPS
jgi:curved DNA-binding protein CbpA